MYELILSALDRSRQVVDELELRFKVCNFLSEAVAGLHILVGLVHSRYDFSIERFLVFGDVAGAVMQ